MLVRPVSGSGALSIQKSPWQSASRIRPHEPEVAFEIDDRLLIVYSRRFWIALVTMDLVPRLIALSSVVIALVAPSALEIDGPSIEAPAPPPIVASLTSSQLLDVGLRAMLTNGGTVT